MLNVLIVLSANANNSFRIEEKMNANVEDNGSGPSDMPPKKRKKTRSFLLEKLLLFRPIDIRH